MIITRPIGSETNDLLVDHEHDTLIITDLDGVKCCTIPPPSPGWTHQALESLNIYQYAVSGWNAYLGDISYWVGSSEV